MSGKWRSQHSCLLGIILISYGFITSIEASCIFDEVKLANPVKQRSPSIRSKGLNNDHISVKNLASSRMKRAPRDEDFQPIRIYVEYHGFKVLNSGFDKIHLERLKKAVQLATYKAEKIFSVVREEGVLLLSRTEEACAATYTNGTNAGKCQSVRSSYRGEPCIDNFVIPDEHLEGLYIYGPSDPEPREVVKEEGTGVADADFILYVRSHFTSRCIEPNPNVQAYATYCQVAHNNRPVAGYINICPSLLQDENFNEHTVHLTALHELFHTLGFSQDLFGKFQECSPTGCFDRKVDDTWDFVAGANRLLTPVAVNFTSRHFNCQTHVSSNEFGPILQTKGRESVGSHWDGAFMYSSIMSPTIGMPYETILDNITLAFFEDTGWYKVNYSYAENFPWGRGGGCRWGIHPDCNTKQVGDCFCGVPNEKGCHYLRKSKGLCKTDEFLVNCFTYKSTQEDSCLHAENNPKDATRAVTGELYGESSRCFLANLSSTIGEGDMLKGRCYETRCNGSDVEVRVGASPWTPCPYGETVDVDGYTGVLTCPEEGILCVDGDRKQKHNWNYNHITKTTPVEDIVSSTTATLRPTYPPEDETSIIVIEIHFANPDYGYLVATEQTEDFKEACVLTILRDTASPSRRVQNVSLRRGSVILQFDLHPAQSRDDGPPSKHIVDTLSNLVDRNEFTVHLSRDGDSYTAYRLLTIETPSVSDDRTPTEVIIGVVVGLVIAALLIGIAVYFVQRFYSIQTQRNAHRNAYRQQQRSVTESDSRNSSQSRASGRSRVSMRSRSSNRTVNLMLGSGVDLDGEFLDGQVEPEPQPEEPQIVEGAIAASYVNPTPRTPDISYDHRSDRTPDSTSTSKPSSRQRTPVSAGRKSRRSSYAHSSNSRASSGDRQANSTGSSHGRRRSRSRSRSSLKLKENYPFTPARNRTTRRSQSTRSSEKPEVQVRENPMGYSNQSFVNDDSSRAYYSPRAPRHQPGKPKAATRTNSQSGNKPRLRHQRPRQQRRKTTQCVFSPRELVNTPELQLNREPIEGFVDPTISKCLEGDDVTTTQCHRQPCDCPLHCTNYRQYDTTTCPLQTPNCSKEDIKESDLPPPVINPRDSDLSFTVDLKDIEHNDSLSVFCAPRHDKVTQPATPQTPPTPVAATPPEVQIRVPTNGYRVEPQLFSPALVQPLHTSAVMRHYRRNGTTPIVDHLQPPPPAVEHLEQLPLMVPIFKLSARDVEAFHRASGSWRSFSSDTSLDSMSTPV